MSSLQHHYGVTQSNQSTPNWSMGATHQYGAKSCMVSANNIERFREARGWSRPALAKRMGTSPQQIERLEKGLRKLTQDWIDRAAESFGVTPGDIIAINPPELFQELKNAVVPGSPSFSRPSDHAPTRSASADDGIIEITALDLSLSMGPGTLIDGFIEGEPVKMDIAVLRAITRSPFEVLRLVHGIGDSMEPTLRTNDWVLIDTSERMMSRLHGVYWIEYEGAHGLKRLRPAGKQRIKVISDNAEAGDTFEVTAQELRIHGRAIWFSRYL